MNLKGFLSLLLATISPIFLFGQSGIDEKINSLFEPISKFVSDIVFFSFNLTENVEVPIVLVILVFAAVYFTIYFNFTNIRDFLLSIKIVRGKYDDLEKGSVEVHSEEYALEEGGGDILKTAKIEDHIGEVNHFQALTAALSATVGLGNIAGVAIAIGIGGPGATFWMILAGLLGMSTKFTECTLGVKYRDIEKDGTVHGGPMYYLKKGFAKRHVPGLGKVLAIFFAIMTVGGSFGGGNMFQSNQATQQLISIFNIESGYAGFTIGIVFNFKGVGYNRWNKKDRKSK
ncbi:MAG: alanine:cation symporter family protein [Saprospiraceae bacterium]